MSDDRAGNVRRLKMAIRIVNEALDDLAKAEPLEVSVNLEEYAVHGRPSPVYHLVVDVRRFEDLMSAEVPGVEA